MCPNFTWGTCFLSQEGVMKMPVDSPRNGQKAARMQRYVTDHRHANFTGPNCQLTSEIVDTGNTGGPSSWARGRKRIGVEGANRG